MHPMPGNLAHLRGLRGETDMTNRINPDELYKCEGCDNDAMTHDSEGIPLCDECAAEMIKDAEEDECKRMKNKESQ